MATTTDIANQKVTYATTDKATLEAIDRAFEEALPRVRAGLGGSQPMYIGGEERRGAEEFEDRSPVDTELVLARFPLGTAGDAADAVAAAVAAFPGWSRTPYGERIAILRRAAENFRARKYDIRTGQSWFNPAKVRVRAYEVDVAPGESVEDACPAAEVTAITGTGVRTTGACNLRKGQYVAKTYPV